MEQKWGPHMEQNVRVSRLPAAMFHHGIAWLYRIKAEIELINPETQTGPRRAHGSGRQGGLWQGRRRVLQFYT